MIQYLDLQKVSHEQGAELEEAARRVVESGRYLLGGETEAFEHEYAQYVGTRHCVGVSNGLDALTLILRAYKEMGIVTEGDEVLVPANTFAASILAITENGLTPVPVEPDGETLEMDEDRLEEAITSRTRALMTVHLYGRLSYGVKMAALCRKYGLKLIEDNAQAHGCRYGNRRTGSLGDAAGHSFYPTKNLGALGDGGAVTTNDDALADCVRELGYYGSRDHCIFDYKGRNCRLDELQAAFLRVKLRRLEALTERRRQIAKRYCEGLDNALVRLPRRLPEEQNVWHIFPILCSERDALKKYLYDKGIETAVHYPVPPHMQPCFGEWQDLSLPVTERICREELSLPVAQTLRDDEADYITECINQYGKDNKTS